MNPSIGRVVIVRGYKQASDGTNETPGIVNGVTLNPTAKDAEEIRSASKKVSDLTVDAEVKEALNKPLEPQIMAEVSPCIVDVAVFPKGADHRNIAGVVFFESKADADKFYEALPSALKALNGAPTGCVAYFPERSGERPAQPAEPKPAIETAAQKKEREAAETADANAEANPKRRSRA